MLHWIAHYDNGETLPQLLQNGETNTYKQIDRDRLISFDIWRNEKLLFRLDLWPNAAGKKHLIWRKRHRIRSDGTRTMFHLVGWLQEDTIQMHAVFDEGFVLSFGDWNDVFHSVKFQRQELEQ